MNMPHHPVRLAPQEAIIRLRGHAVILDVHLAALYGVETRKLNQQVKRNPDRFPASFAFQPRNGSSTAQQWMSIVVTICKSDRCSKIFTNSHATHWVRSTHSVKRFTTRPDLWRVGTRDAKTQRIPAGKKRMWRHL
jgi:hypothetical protein